MVDVSAHLQACVVLVDVVEFVNEMGSMLSWLRKSLQQIQIIPRRRMERRLHCPSIDNASWVL